MGELIVSAPDVAGEQPRMLPWASEGPKPLVCQKEDHPSHPAECMETLLRTMDLVIFGVLLKLTACKSVLAYIH